MKKYSILLLSIVALNGCIESAKSVVETDNPGIKVEFLFEKDGCKVYRFKDGGYKYFTTCQGSTSWTESCGKNCHKQVDCPTAIK